MLKDILAISGQPGLYKLISNTKNGIIVENLETKKRMPSYATAKVSALEDISIYTEEGEDKPLAEVMIGIREKENGGKTLSHKSSTEELKTYFNQIMPDYDKDQVYISDIKKVLQWYNVLQGVDLVSSITAKEEEKEEAEKSEEVK